MSEVIVRTGTNNLGPIVIALIVCALLLGFLFYKFSESHHNEVDTDDPEPIATKIVNKTHSPQLVLFAGNEATLLPDASLELGLKLRDKLKTSSSVGKEVKLTHSYIITSPIHTLFIRPEGIFSNLTVTQDIRLLNNSSFPVIFVEKNKTGKKLFSSEIIPPHRSLSNIFVVRGREWEVVRPLEEKNPISKVSVGVDLQDIEFDGSNLFVR